MYAVIKSGGKQHRVKQGEKLKLEKIDAEVGKLIQFDDVLMVGEGDQAAVGAPYVQGSQVTAKVTAQGRHKKIRIIKFRRRKHSMTQAGHRQYYTEVEITAIKGGN